jgi:ADP-ribose pyrophosphatase YjhB (NUDIX family)
MECRVHKLVADVAVLSGGSVLLVKYRDTSRYDGQKGWFLPDDSLEREEHPDEAGKRILRDQVGLTDVSASLHHVESFGNGAWHLIFHYAVELPEGADPMPSENVAAAEWFPLDSLPDPDDVAHHGWALDVLEQITAG